MSEGVIEINKRLIDHYGRAENNLPKFRLSWSTSQYEKRYGVFEVYSGDIFLRTEQGIEEVPKYPEFPDRWILERLLPTIGNPYLEMVAKFSYEPVWVFGSGGSEKQPIWRAVQLLVNEVLNTRKKFLTRKDFEDIEAKRMAEEKAKIKEILKDDSPYIPGMLHSGSAIVVPSNYQKEEK